MTASDEGQAINAAPVLANPGNQTNTDISSYAQAVLGDSPAAYWRLDESSGASVADAAGSSTGAYAPAVVLGRPGALADGNTAAQFDGTDGTHVSIPNTPALERINGTTAVTMEAWVNARTLELPLKFRMFFSFPLNGASYLGISTASGTPKAILALWIGAKQYHITSGPALVAGAWYHIAGTYDGSRLVLYVNGQVAGEITGLAGPLSIGTAGLMLGGHPLSGYSFDGTLDDAAIYDRALTGDQVAAHYAQRVIGAGAVALQLSATDPDGDPLAFSATGLPPPLTIDPVTGFISGTLTRASAGSYPVEVSASDGQLTHTQSFNWTVTHINRAPTLPNPGTRTTRAGETVALAPGAADPDGDALTYTAAGLPPDLTLNAQTGAITGTPLPANMGNYPVTLTASDGQLSATQTFTWVIASSNRPPSLINPGDVVTTGRTAGYFEAVLGDGPISYWRMGDLSGVQVTDSAGRSPGTPEGGIARGKSGALADGDFAIGFDGADGTRVAVPNNAALSAINNSSALTLEAWIQPQTLTMPGGFRMFFSFPGRPASYLGMTRVNGAAKVIAALWINGKQHHMTVGPSLEQGQWYHTVTTYDGSRMKLYVNGLLAGQINDLSGPVSIGSSGVAIGAHPYSGYNYGFEGSVDEAAIYNYALTAPQVAKHYARRTTAGTDVALQVAAGDPDGDTLTFSAAGLPAHLTINPATGLISGTLTPEDAGNYYVTVTVSDGQLSRSESFVWTATNLAAYPDTVISNRPSAFWRLDETSGTGVADSAGGSHGVRSAGVTVGHTGALADENGAMGFDGLEGTIVSIPNTPALAALDGSSAITLEAWIKPFTTSPPSRFGLFYSFFGKSASYLGTTNTSGPLRPIAALWINGRQHFITLGPSLSAGSWYHLVATYDGARMTLYVNGESVGQITGLSGPVSIGTQGVSLGGHPLPGYDFDGLVDDAAIYGYALTPAQVATHYAMRRATPMTSLTLSSDLPAPQPAGTTISFKAAVTGGAAPHEFKWFAYSSAMGWSLLRDWSTDDTFVWNPLDEDFAGQITVWARSSGDPTNLPEKSADLPYGIFVPGTANAAQLVTSDTELDLSRPLAWTPVTGAQAYRLQLSTRAGGSDLGDTGEVTQTTAGLPDLSAAQRPSMVAWDYDGEADALGFAMLLDNERVQLGGLAPVDCSASWSALCYEVPLPPLPDGPHSVAIAAYNSAGEAHSARVNITKPIRSILARLWTKHNGEWRFRDTEVRIPNFMSEFVHPIANALNVDVTRPLQWNAVPGAQAYSLTIGTSPGAAEFVNIPSTLETSYSAWFLPGGMRLYARLGTQVAGVWRYLDSTFVVSPAVAWLVHPADGSVAPGATTFSWTGVPDADAYSLQVGTAPGAADMINSGEITALGYEASLPPATRLYVRLGTKLRGTWRYVDSTFTTAAIPGTVALATFITPTDGAVVGSEVEFRWTEVPGVAGFHVHVGASPGADDYGMSADYLNDTKWTATGLPSGAVIYVRLYTQFQIGDWAHYVDMIVTTPPAAGTQP